MRRSLRHFRYVLFVWLTATSTLLAAVPRFAFGCACPASCTIPPQAKQACCSESESGCQCCPQTTGENASRDGAAVAATVQLPFNALPGVCACPAIPQQSAPAAAISTATDDGQALTRSLDLGDAIMEWIPTAAGAPAAPAASHPHPSPQRSILAELQRLTI